MFAHLFSPGRIGTMETRNRLVFTAMGNALANTDGTVSGGISTFTPPGPRGA